MPNQDLDKSLHTRRGVIGLGVGAAATALIGPALAQTADEGALVDAARKEGKGVLYQTFVATASKIVDGFKRKYAVDLELVLLSSTAQLVQRFAAESQAGQTIADVIGFTHDGSIMPGFVERGWIAKLDSSIPNLARVPARYRADHYVINGMALQGVAWNTKLVPGGLKDWTDILDPKWKGQIITTDPAAGPKIGQWIVAMKQTYGNDFLQRFAAQQPRIQPTNAGFQQVGAGAAAIFAPVSAGTVQTSIDAGAPVAYKIPSTAMATLGIIGIPARAPHPNIAKLLFNYYLSDEGQKIIADSWDMAPMPGVVQRVETPTNLIIGNEKEGEAAIPEILKAMGLS
jgi:iron(III) transport system substrate-binding protein